MRDEETAATRRGPTTPAGERLGMAPSVLQGVAASDPPLLVDELYARACRTSSDIHEHLPTLRRYAQGCASVTEMGVRRGMSTTAFLAARPQSIVSYDLDGRYFRRHREALYARAAREAGVEFAFFERNVLEITIAPTDVLFIDTWHVYEQLARELTLHATQARRYIVLHDTETFGVLGEDPVRVRAAWRANEACERLLGLRPFRKGTRRRGLIPAIEEFLGVHVEWRIAEHFDNNNGLTVLARCV